MRLLGCIAIGLISWILVPRQPESVILTICLCLVFRAIYDKK